MRRVAVLGPAGSGKSEVAARISESTGLPVVHLDLLFWRAGWRPAPRREALTELARAIAGERWILDGNFLDAEADVPRFGRADTVVFLDLPRTLCLGRVLGRIVRDRGRTRADLPDGCRERLNLPLLRWIWRYPRTDRPKVLALLAGLGPEVDARHLRSRRDVHRYLESVR